MSRFHATPTGPVPFTAQEEADRDAEEAAVAAANAAAAPELARVAAIDTTISADATIQSLKAMSATDFDAWWAANVTTLSQANNVLKRIARVVLRRLL